MKFKSTEGNGGPPLVLHKGKLDAPEIPRGSIALSLKADKRGVMPDAVTFNIEQPSHVLTYHDIQVVSVDPDGSLVVFVGPSDVVTWVYRD